ncbi:ANTAR domain-containing protein, partial [Actinospica sp. MGRD01-02]
GAGFGAAAGEGFGGAAGNGGGPAFGTGFGAAGGDGFGAGFGEAGRLASTVDRLRGQVREAHAAADGRALIELAKGILIERWHFGPAEAARQLAELADQSGMSVLELSADIINQSARDRVAQIAADFLQGTNAPSEPDRAALAVRLRAAESAALAAGDTQTIAESLLLHALAPLGANAVAVWSVNGDGSLLLSGHAGFGDDEAARWRYVPPGVTTVARQAIAGRSTVRLESVGGVPSIGSQRYPSGGRMAICAGTGGRIHGVLEICWPGALSPQPPAVERQLEALAELCAHTLETLPTVPLSPADAAEPDPSALELADLADGLHDPALVLTPHLDGDGRLVDFRIRHANVRFNDPA